METGYYELRKNILKRMLLYWIKILEMSDARFPAKCYHMSINNYDIINGSRSNWFNSLKQTLNETGFTFLWDQQSPSLVRLYLPYVLQTIADQQRNGDESRLGNSSINVAYRQLNPDTNRKFYIGDSSLYLQTKQILFKLRQQSDSLFVNGKIVNFILDDMCPFCACDFDSIRHLLESCLISMNLRTVEIDNLIKKFYSPYQVTSSEQNFIIYRYATACLALRHDMSL